MEELVKEYKGEALTSSLLIAEKFNKRHGNVLAAIKLLECSKGFLKLNFKSTLKTRDLPNGGKKIERFYVITKDGFSFLTMGFTGKQAARFKEDYIKAFNAMEVALQRQMPGDYPTALRALADATEHNTKMVKALEEAKPHIEFSKTVQNIDKDIDMKKVAAIIGIKGFGRNKLFEFLRERKILMSDNIPYRLLINRGLFKVIETTISDKLFVQTIVTQKGLSFIIKKLKDHGLMDKVE